MGDRETKGKNIKSINYCGIEKSFPERRAPFRLRSICRVGVKLSLGSFVGRPAHFRNQPRARSFTHIRLMNGRRLHTGLTASLSKCALPLFLNRGTVLFRT